MPDRKPKPEIDQGAHAAKTCAACGRTMEWRKAWAANWDSVRFCSDACRRRKPGAKEAAIEAEILRLLAERGAGKTICPSEVARALAEGDDRDAWEPLMQPVRHAAQRLVAAEKIVITQHGHAVDASTAKGPVRLRLR